MADQIGIPTQIVDGLQTTWETTLDAYSSSDYALMWFFKPVSSTNFTDFIIGDANAGGSWCSSIVLDAQEPSWTYELKVRKIEGNEVSNVSNGTFNVLIVLDDLEAQIRAIRDALTKIGRGEQVQSYSIRGRSLTQYSLTELSDLYDKLKRELAAKKREQQKHHGYLLGNFGPPHTHWYSNPNQGYR